MKAIMKKMGLVMTAFLVVIGLAACSSTPKVTPTEVVSLYMDAMTTQNFEELNAYTGLDESVDTLLDEMKAGMPSVAGTGLTAAETDELAESILNGLKKVTYTVEEVSQEKDIAVVNLTITGFDLSAFMSQIQADVTTKAMNGELTSEAEATKYVFQEMIKFFNNPTMATSPTFDSSLRLKKVGNKWMLEDDEDVYTSLGEGLFGM